MTKVPVNIPHALAAAYDNLVAVLDLEIRESETNSGYSTSHGLFRGIERFVDALADMPGGQEELRRRATLVESRCGPESAYHTSRRDSVASYRGQPRKRTGSKEAIRRLRESIHRLEAGTRLSLRELDDERQDIERVLDEGILNLTDAARAAFESWRSACRAIQKEADPLEVDGCWHLYHIHQSGEDSPTDYAMIAQAMPCASGGYIHLAAMRAATESLMAWAKERVYAAELAGRDSPDVIVKAGDGAQGGDDADATKQTGPTSKSKHRAQWLAQAMLLVRDHPDWSDAGIARHVGKHKSTLSRSKEYQAAAAMARGVKNDRRRGHISVDPDSGLRDVEAYSDYPAERDWGD